MSTEFDFDATPFSFFDSSESLAGLGLGGAAFAAQTGRAPTAVPSGPLSPFAQSVAANDAARLARTNFGSQTLGNLPPRGSLSPAVGPSGGTTLPSQPSLQDARSAAARSAAARTTASALSRFAGPGAALLGIVDLGSRALTGKGIGEIGGELVGNVLFPGAQSRSAAFGAGTLQELAEMGGYSPPEDDFLSGDDRRNPTITPLNFYNPEAGRRPVPEEVIAEFSPASNLFSLESAAQVNPMLRDVDLGSFAPTIEDSQFPTQTLSQFLRNEDDPSQRTEQFVDEQGRLRRRLTPQAAILQGFTPDSVILAPEYSGIEKASADRLARLEARDFLPGETPVQRDTRLANARTQGSGNVPLDVIEAINTPSNRRTPKQIKRISQWEASEQGKAMGGVAGLIEERTQFEPRIVEIDGQRLIQLSPTYFQPIRPEPKEGEKFEPRVITINDFVYVEESANNFKRQPLSNFVSQEDMLNKLSEELGQKLNSENIVTGNIRSFDTEAEAEASGVKGEVLIGGRRAVIE